MKLYGLISMFFFHLAGLYEVQEELLLSSLYQCPRPGVFVFFQIKPGTSHDGFT